MIRIILSLLLTCTLFAAEEIAGFWTKMSDDTGKPQCIFAIYQYDGLYYGRIIATYDDDGKITDTIYTPIKRAPGVVDNPFYCGLDMIYELADDGDRFKGKILDPEKGNIYNSEVWIEGSNLNVRGKILFLGRTMTWYPTAKSAFPKGFKVPDLKTLVPTIPQVQ